MSIWHEKLKRRTHIQIYLMQFLLESVGFVGKDIGTEIANGVLKENRLAWFPIAHYLWGLTCDL